MRFVWALVLAGALLQGAYAGDDASGSVLFRVDLSQNFKTYSMTAQDKLWSASLTTRLGYKGSVIHFVRTSLPLDVAGKTIQGAVYQAVEKRDFFYVVKSDSMLKLGTTWVYSPGVGGFSMHAPKSRDFIVCFHFVDGGVPFLSSSPVRKEVVTWKGDDDRDRLKGCPDCR